MKSIFVFRLLEALRAIVWGSVFLLISLREKKSEGAHVSITLVVLVVASVSLGVWVVPGALADQEKLGLEAKWTFNTSAQFADELFGAGHQGCQIVWDVDGDGVNEVVFGTRRGDSKRLWCIDQYSQFEWIYPPIGEDGLLGDPLSKVSVVDVDNDGIYELCLAGRGGRLHVLNGDGEAGWTWDNPTGSHMLGAPQAYDVDGDGFIEFFLNDNAGFVHRVNHLGELVWTSFQTEKDNQGQPTIADIDRDGEYEVLWASQDHNVYCMNANTGKEKWRLDTGASMATNSVIVADVNRDGEYEAIVWTDPPESSVICINPYGEEVWRWAHPRQGRFRLCQAMGDIDEDGGMDMALMSGNGAFCIDISGGSPSLNWEINFSEWSRRGLLPQGAVTNSWTSYQLIADIDGDGQQEVLWLAPFPIITDGATGELEAYYWNEHVAVNRRQENGGWFGDVDQDGVSEWIVELNGNFHTETQLYCLTAGGSFPAQSPWPEYYHSAYPAEYQEQQDWLTLKGAYSNSLWFPVSDILRLSVISLCLVFVAIRT